ncbi:MAG: hypothetical protein KBD48_03085 [Candidatus Pacebacteria bacterium]|nr:hypothetical protein [Candidatus Paceibacterota bacterium]MBP9716144.1 hypothetical protein [Candidatus Paceibacterota bacterium]
MPDSKAAQEAPKKLDFEKDFKLISNHRIPYVDCGCMPDLTPKKKLVKKTKKEEVIISVQNLSSFDLNVNQTSKNSEMSVEIRQTPDLRDITLRQAYRSISKTKKIIIPKLRIIQIIKSLSRSCLDMRNEIYDSPSRTINFFVKLKDKKIEEKGVFVYRVTMTKGKKFEIVIWDLDDSNIIKGQAGQLFAIDASCKH